MDTTSLSLWRSLAFEIVRRLAATGSAFSTDDVWRELGDLPMPNEPRALGPVLTRACAQRIVVKSGIVVTSQRRECHGRPVNVWLSVERGATLPDAAAYVARQKQTLPMPLFVPLDDATTIGCVAVRNCDL